MLTVLPVFGFLTLSIHAGYAIYFRSCFPVICVRRARAFVSMGDGCWPRGLVLSGRIKALPGLDLRSAVCFLSLLFSLGLVVLWFLPRPRIGRC